MKSLLSIACLFIATLSAPTSVAANWPPPNSTFTAQARKEHAQFKAHRDEHHPWRKNMPMPTTLAEAGLTEDVKLVWTDSYLDGGTRGFLFKDPAGNYLAVCTGPGLQTKDLPNRIDAPVGSLLFIGGLHHLDPRAQLIEPDSSCEMMIRSLLKNSGQYFTSGLSQD